MKDADIHRILERSPRPMEVVCKTCGRFYGSHRGFACPIGRGKFDPFVDTDKNDPNLAFKYKKGN